ncbi:MAG TPA: hypothetical protein EYH44_04465 [Thermoprotei archaeon]|nr:hypothetical protein [Thermoprotei archaeon]
MADSIKKVLLLLMVVGIVINISIISFLLFDLQPRLGGAAALEPTVEVILYAGELEVDGGLAYGFGLSPDEISSPGPDLEFKQGDVVRFIIRNVGEIPHNFAIVRAVDPLNPDIVDDYQTPNINSNEEIAIVVQFNQVGELQYQCTVPGHSDLGMWGNITISP